jgi:chaperonin GroES
LEEHLTLAVALPFLFPLAGRRILKIHLSQVGCQSKVKSRVGQSLRGFFRPPSMSKATKKTFEYVEPIGARVLVRKDDPKRETKGGIALPDAAEIPTITGRIVSISAQIDNDEDLPLRQYDKILFHPKNAIPVDFESDNQLFVIPVEDIVAVFRRDSREETP